MSASDVSPPFHQLFHLLLTLAAGRVWLCLFLALLVCQGIFSIPPRVVDLDDRQAGL